MPALANGKCTIPAAQVLKSEDAKVNGLVVGFNRSFCDFGFQDLSCRNRALSICLLSVRAGDSRGSPNQHSRIAGIRSEHESLEIGASAERQLNILLCVSGDRR